MSKYFSAFEYSTGRIYIISGCETKSEVQEFCRSQHIITIGDAIHELTEEEYLERKKYKEAVDKGAIKHKNSKSLLNNEINN